MLPVCAMDQKKNNKQNKIDSEDLKFLQSELNQIVDNSNNLLNKGRVTVRLG